MLLGPGPRASLWLAFPAGLAIAGAFILARSGTGAATWPWAAGVGLMIAAWGLGVRDLSFRPARWGDRAVVFVTAALVGFVFVLSPGPRDPEASALLERARMLSAYGANPYLPTSVGVDPGVPDMPAPAPGLTSTAAIATWIGGQAPRRGLICLRLLLLAVHLMSGWLVAHIAAGWQNGRHVPGARGALFLLWSPVVLEQSIGECHGGGVALFWILTAILLLQRREAMMAAACAGMSAVVAWSSLPLAAILAAHRRAGSGARAAMTFGASTLIVVVLGVAPYLPGLTGAAFPFPWRDGTRIGGAAWQVGRVVAVAAGRLGLPEAAAVAPAALTTIAWCGLAVWLILLCRREADLQGRVVAMVRFALVGVLVASASLRPGDAIVAAGLAACIASVSVRRAAACACASLLLLDLPLARGNPIAGWMAAVAVGVPISYILLRFRRRTPGGPATFAGEEAPRT